MSRYATFACMDCKISLFLGKIVFHAGGTIHYFHLGAIETPNSHRLELNRVLWKMLADHAGHPLCVLVEGTPEYDTFMNDEQVVRIGGDEPGHDISFEESLRGWGG